MKDLLDELHIESYVKTSGKTGLHVFVPVAPIYTYDQTRTFAEIIGKMLSCRNPDKITMEWNSSNRKGKVFFDYNQNAKGKTLASIFSVRPTISASVSMPVKWRQLSDIQHTRYFISKWRCMEYYLPKETGFAQNDTTDDLLNRCIYGSHTSLKIGF